MGSLEVWLVKAGEHDMAVRRLQLRVDILSTICFVLEVLEPLTVIDVVGFELDRNLVETDFLVYLWNIYTMVSP